MRYKLIWKVMKNEAKETILFDFSINVYRCRV